MDILLAAGLSGFGLMAGLIVAIGAENAFLLRQGLLKSNVLLLVVLAACLDSVLIIAGVSGFGAFVHAHPALLLFVCWAGAAFLFCYGLSAVLRAFKPRVLNPADGEGLQPWPAVRGLLAVSLLNPHVYLDTVVLAGGISGRYAGDGRIAWTVGACLASTIWFFLLGFGAQLLRPVFARPLAWRVLDGVIALVMFLIAAGLVQSALAGNLG